MLRFEDSYQAPRVYDPSLRDGEKDHHDCRRCMCGREFNRQCETQTRCPKCMDEMFGIEIRRCRISGDVIGESSARLFGKEHGDDATYDKNKKLIDMGCKEWFLTKKNSEEWLCSACFENTGAAKPSLCTIGAIKELLVSADLLEQGFEVFRSVSPNASCDLIIHRNGEMWKVEVRTGKDGKREKVVTNSVHRADVLAVVTPTRIVYDPSDFSVEKDILA